MANYANLKAAIDTVIKANGQQEITGTVLNQTLTAMVNSLGAGYLFMGVAIPSTNPGTPDQNVFYLAGQAGTYSNFGAITLQAGLSILKYNGTWSSETLFTFDASITQNSGNLITSGAVFEKMKLDGGAYDVSAHNNNQTFASLSALLSDANLSTLIPTNIRSGGMSIKFIQTSDNKYVQYRLMSDEWSATVANWQGVDVEPIVMSKNLVESGGVVNYSKRCSIYIEDIINNNDFTDTTKWSNVRCSVAYNGDDTYTITHDSSTNKIAYLNWRNKLSDNFVSGHLYLTYAEIYSDNPFESYFYIGNGFTEHIQLPSETWCNIYGIYSPTADSELGVYFIRRYYTPQGDTFKIKTFKCIDITKTFGFSEIDDVIANRIINYLKGHTNGPAGANIDNNSFISEKNCIIIAGNNSIYSADIVCRGKDDQEIINKIISLNQVSKIIFTNDSIFNISSPIILKSNLEIISNGARFENNLDSQLSLYLRSQYSVGEEYLNLNAGCEHLLPGMYIEVIDSNNSSIWGTFLCGDVRYDTKRIYLSSTQLPNTKGLRNGFPINSIVRNVSSCFSGYQIENVKISGIEIYWNYPSNSRSPETFWAQNGMHFCNCNNILVEKCKILHGGRHGILTYYSTNVSILHCIFDNWGEHGVDIYDTNSDNPRATYNIIDGCVSKNNVMCGIQAHSGSRTRIVNNYCFGNQKSGINNTSATFNIIANNICESNSLNGISIDSHCSHIDIIGNICKSNTRNGIETDRYSTDILINGNIIINSGWYGIQCSNAEKLLITSNKFTSITRAGINLLSCQKNVISLNLFDGGKAYTIVREDSNTDYSIIQNNTIVTPMTSPELSGQHSIDSNNVII